jgi:outer membrane protein OmpA-like peptidoglycan-associated protein
MKVLLTSIILFCSCTAWPQTKQSVVIYFDFDKYDLDSRARLQLDSFIKTQKQVPARDDIELAGYCDITGSEPYNDQLSSRRVVTVKKYLLANRVDPATITAVTGHGEKNPLNDNSTDEERRLNRRVEISILPYDSASANHVSLQEKIAASTTVAGTNIVLHNINFYGGRNEFLPESYPMLQELLEAMKKYPVLVIEIQGHICCQPGDDDGFDGATGIYNLSFTRAKAIRDYLIVNGIESDRVSYKGLGHSQPIYPYPEQTEEERIANRRVEIKILKK